MALCGRGCLCAAAFALHGPSRMPPAASSSHSLCPDPGNFRILQQEPVDFVVDIAPHRGMSHTTTPLSIHHPPHAGLDAKYRACVGAPVACKGLSDIRALGLGTALIGHLQRCTRAQPHPNQPPTHSGPPAPGFYEHDQRRPGMWDILCAWNSIWASALI